MLKNLPKFGRILVRILIILVLAIIFLFPWDNASLSSIKTQEFFSYHINDILNNLDNKDTSDFYLSTGSYESSRKDELFGIGKGRNLIVVQLESMQNFVIDFKYKDNEITPFLNDLIDDDGTIYFDNYYQQLGSGNTSDAEFATNNSILGTVESYTYQLYEINYFKGLQIIRKEEG